jgi:transglutaminase-like putative cysteine protease
MLRPIEPSSGITSTPHSSDIMQYTVRHLTRFTYDSPISESIMEVRMQPRTEQHQRCLGFELTTTPRATVTAYRDPLSNIVHHFDIPGRHGQLTIVAEAIVEFVGAPHLPASLPIEAWAQVEAIGHGQTHWDFLQASVLTQETPLLKAFEATLANGERRDPLSEVLAINEAIHRRFTYRQQVTGVDSPIDHALETGEGVCQDFAHVMLACVRRLGIPGRYVSGYLFHGSDDTSADGATHAWIEAFLPGLGWVGFDPTNNVVAGTRHIRVAIGRDYADVPPTKGVFRGRSANELAVAVQVSLADTTVLTRELMPVMTWTTPETEGAPDWDLEQSQQQQQQQ